MSTKQSKLDGMCRASSDAKVGTVIADLIAAHNLLLAKYQALLAKLDTDAGVSGTDFASTCGAASAVVSGLETAR